MARFARIDSQIRGNRLKLPEMNPFLFENRATGHLKIPNRRFEVIRANRWVMKMVFIRANRFVRIAPIRVANRWAI